MQAAAQSGRCVWLPHAAEKWPRSFASVHVYYNFTSQPERCLPARQLLVRLALEVVFQGALTDGVWMQFSKCNLNTRSASAALAQGCTMWWASAQPGGAGARYSAGGYTCQRCRRAGGWLGWQDSDCNACPPAPVGHLEDRRYAGA